MKDYLKSGKPGTGELLFLPLGGAGEIGMNLNLYGHNGAWLMVDLGVSFGEDSIPGIEVNARCVQPLPYPVGDACVPHGQHLSVMPDNIPSLIVDHFNGACRCKLVEQPLGVRSLS